MEKFLGQITLKDKIVISDPCYDNKTWCQGVYDKVAPGKYNCYVNYFYDSSWCPNYRRVANIIIVHEKYKSKVATAKNTEHTIGIDSGQMGIFDYDYFQNFNGHSDDNWYSRVCDLTQESIINPHFKSFEDSEYCEKHLTMEEIFSIGDKDERIKKMVERYKKLSEYHNNSISREKIEAASASTLDNVCLVSATAWGDMDPTVYFRYNANGEIIAIRLQSK